jgi:hypothetical protein
VPVAGIFTWHQLHLHYHFPLASFGLHSVNADGSVGPSVAMSPKLGFCIGDTNLVNSLPGAPPSIVYDGTSCGDPAAMRGISVGWGDEYGFDDYGQSIDITSLPDGVYWFRTVVDPDDYLLEMDKSNNITDLELRISGLTVSVVGGPFQPTSRPPTVSLTSPAYGAVVTGSAVQLSATASDATGIQSVQFLLDGGALGARLTTSPFSLLWDSTQVAGGTHWLSVSATNGAGMTGTVPVAEITVLNPPPTGSVSLDRSVQIDANGTVTTPSLSTSGPNETLLAMVASDGPIGQAVSVAGGGLTWHLLNRSNSWNGTAEVWSAAAATQLSGATITSTQSSPGYDQSLTVLALSGASGVGATAGGSDDSSPPSVTLTTTAAGSTILGVGFDWSSPSAHVPLSGQYIAHQWIDQANSESFWTQGALAPSAAPGSRVSFGNGSPTSDMWNLTAVEVVPAAGLVISNVAAGSLTSSSAVISWNTSAPASSMVDYGTTSAYSGATNLDATLVTTHSQTITGLQPGTAYHYRVDSTAAGSTVSSPDSTFTTAPPPPSISNVAAGNTSANSATITWITSTLSDSLVNYGTTIAYGSTTGIDTALVTSHARVLSGLLPSTTYHYQVKSQDAFGQTAGSSDFTFITAPPPAPPTVSGVTVSGVTNSGAVIGWTTSTPAGSQVLYGTTSAYGSSNTLDTMLVTSHSQSIGGLAAGTTYHFQIVSTDSYGQAAYSTDQTLATSTTPPPPPAFRSAATATNSTTVARPPNVAPGDLLVALLEVDEDPVTVSGPAGWRLLKDVLVPVNPSTAFHAQVWYKVAQATEPSSYTWSIPAGVWTDIGVLDYYGVSSSAPFDGYSGANAGVTRTPSTPALTTTSANDLIVALFTDYSFGSWTAGSGTTQRFNFDSNTAEDIVQSVPGSTGAKTATNSSSGATSAFLIALRPGP